MLNNKYIPKEKVDANINIEYTFQPKISLQTPDFKKLHSQRKVIKHKPQTMYIIFYKRQKPFLGLERHQKFSSIKYVKEPIDINKDIPIIPKQKQNKHISNYFYKETRSNKIKREFYHKEIEKNKRVSEELNIQFEIKKLKHRVLIIIV